MKDRWPLAMSHLLNSKLSTLTAPWKTESIAEFAANEDAVLEATQARRVYPRAERIPLRPSRAAFGPSLWKVLRSRRTSRSFSERDVPIAQIGRILSAAAGVTGAVPVAGTRLEQKLRAWPSAGALYPLELYLVAFDGPLAGVYHHDPVDSCLEVLKRGPIRERLAPHVVTLGEELTAPLLWVISAVPDRVMRKYGERGYRFLWLDAGHLAQNLALASTAAGLATCPIGGFHEDALAAELGIDARETVVYLMASGLPRRPSRA